MNPKAKAPKTKAPKAKAPKAKAPKAKAPKAKAPKAKAPKAKAPKADRKPREGLSQIEACAEVLKSGPKTIREIMDKIAEGNLWMSPSGKTPENTLRAALLTHIKKGGTRFKRVEKGLYSLAS